MIEKLEDGIIRLPHFFVGQYGDAITAIADDQVFIKAAVKIPSCVSEALFYLFLIHVLPSRSPRSS